MKSSDISPQFNGKPMTKSAQTSCAGNAVCPPMARALGAANARHFDAAFVSIARLRRRRSDFAVGDWILDSGAFSEVARHGGYRTSVAQYAEEVRRWARVGNLLAAVAQDWMCEPFVVAKTGLSVAEHQRLTIERYDELAALVTRRRSRLAPCPSCGGGRSPPYVLPVLQGYAPADYAAHVHQYGARLAAGAWVGVGSVCKRNGDPGAIEDVLTAIHAARPDLRLHGFGLKTTALGSGQVLRHLHTADSMAWSYNARRNGRNGNDWRQAKRWVDRVTTQRVQWPLF